MRLTSSTDLDDCAAAYRAASAMLAEAISSLALRAEVSPQLKTVEYWRKVRDARAGDYRRAASEAR